MLDDGTPGNLISAGGEVRKREGPSKLDRDQNLAYNWKNKWDMVGWSSSPVGTGDPRNWPVYASYHQFRQPHGNGKSQEITGLNR